jgi:hypothetical protein
MSRIQQQIGLCKSDIYAIYFLPSKILPPPDSTSMSKTQKDVEQHRLLPENNDDEIGTPFIRNPIKPCVGAAVFFLLGFVLSGFFFIAFVPSRTRGSHLEIYCELIRIRFL